jgi:hypothetical protein
MARRTALSIGLGLLITGAVWQTTRPPTVPCDAESPAGSSVHGFHPTAVTVRPWFGPHHVYGVFIVPEEYASRKYSESLRVGQYQFDLARTRFPKPQRVDNVVATPGTFVKRFYLPTRAALWLLITGHFGEVRTLCHWTLVFTERAPLVRSAR